MGEVGDLFGWVCKVEKFKGFLMDLLDFGNFKNKNRKLEEEFFEFWGKRKKRKWVIIKGEVK